MSKKSKPSKSRGGWNTSNQQKHSAYIHARAKQLEDRGVPLNPWVDIIKVER